MTGSNDKPVALSERFSLRRALTTQMPEYLRNYARSDALAGLTVAVMGVPQGMAYALIAGVPPVYGLYTAIVCCAVAAISGSSNHLVTGPTNALCMVILSLTAHLPAKYGFSLLECVFLLTFMTGLIQLAFGLLKMGGIVKYVSNSVVAGFTAGAGILIAVNQLKNVMGVQVSREHAERFYEVLYHTIKLIPESNPVSLAVGGGTALALILLPKLHKKIPAALAGVGLATLAVWLFQLHSSDMGDLKITVARDIEPIRRSLNIFHVPDLVVHPHYELVRELGMGALALAILGLIEAASIARAVAAQSGQRLNFTREFTAQGIGNITGSFFGNLAGSGSFTRTAVNYQAGARTRMAAIFSALWTALTILIFAPVANLIPTASLAGLLVVIAFSMIEKHRLALAWKSGSNSRVVLFGTLFSTLIFPLEYAIFVGIILSIFFLLRITGKTDLTQLVPRTDAGFDEVPFNRAADSPIAIVNLEGDLYFAAVEDLDYELQQALTPMTRVVVLRMKRLRAVGSTAMAILEHFYEMLRERNIMLVVCGIEDEVADVMTKSGFRQEIGEQNIFYADNKLFQSTELAMARALSIVEMEKRRDTAATQPRPVPATGLTARTIMTRNCVRFGSQHQLREAIWLMSEMNSRVASKEPPSLFLQDKEGRLVGKLSLWRLLRELTQDLDLEVLCEKPDRELSQALVRRINERIHEMARTDLAIYAPDMSLARLIHLSFAYDMQNMPVCDAGRRVIGLVGQSDLLRGVSKALARNGAPTHVDPES